MLSPRRKPSIQTRYARTQRWRLTGSAERRGPAASSPFWRQQVLGSVAPRVSSFGLLTGGQPSAAGPCCPAGLPEGLTQLPVLYQAISFFSEWLRVKLCFEQSIAPPVPKLHDLLTRVKKIILRWPPFTVFLCSLFAVR